MDFFSAQVQATNTQWTASYLCSELFRMIFCIVANLQRSASGNAGDICLHLLNFLRQFFLQN